MKQVRYEDLTDKPWMDGERPLVDRELTTQLSTYQQQFRDFGVLCIPDLMPEANIAAYRSVRDKLMSDGGWNMPCPYLHFSEIREICLYRPLVEMAEHLIGHPMGLHLNLTGYVSTERNFHMDDYLNPEHVKSHYVAVWIALEDIDPKSGVFQYVPGSNRWPVIRQNKVFEIMAEDGISPSDPLWPTKTQDWIAGACEQKIEEMGAQVVDYVPKKGDVLFWHGCLIHRGSKPIDKSLKRHALIAHYSSVNHRPDMPNVKYHTNADFDAEGIYFDTGMPLEGSQRV